MCTSVNFNIFHLKIHKKITKILWHANKYIIFFGNLTKNSYVGLAVVMFLLDKLRKKTSVPLTKKVLCVLKILAAHWMKIAGLHHYKYEFREFTVISTICTSKNRS